MYMYINIYIYIYMYTCIMDSQKKSSFQGREKPTKFLKTILGCIKNLLTIATTGFPSVLLEANSADTKIMGIYGHPPNATTPKT